jgi:hypothetical protein
MAESKLPYLNAYGNIMKALEKIQGAETPDWSGPAFADSCGL